MYFADLPDNGDGALSKAQFRELLLTKVEEVAELADRYGHEARQFLISANAGGIAGVIAYRTVDGLSSCTKVLLAYALGSFSLGVFLIGLVLAINFFSFQDHHAKCSKATLQFLDEQLQGRRALSWEELAKSYKESEISVKARSTTATRLGLISAVSLAVGIVFMATAAFN